MATAWHTGHEMSGSGRAANSVPLNECSTLHDVLAGTGTGMASTQTDFRCHVERVLFVDDEESLVFLMTQMLQRLGYHVTGCTSPEEALELFRSEPENFDIVVSDLSMPQMSGVDLAQALLQIRPGMPILIASGYFVPADNEKARSLGLPDLFLKPDTIEKLGHALHRVIAKRKPAASEG